MDRFPRELFESIPPLGNDPDTPLRDTLIYARLFDPASSWQWFVIEFDGNETCFGLILTRSSAVAGMFTLGELSNIDAREPGEGPGVIFDPEFRPRTVALLSDSHPGVRELLAEPVPRELNLPGGLVDLE